MALLVAVLLAGASSPVAWPSAVHAQEGPGEERGEDAADSLRAWDLALSSKLSATQAAYSNWTEGGINTLALTAGVNGTANRTSRRWEQTYDLRLSLGFIQQDTLSVRKADDRIRLTAALQYEGNGFFRRFNPTVAASARTQFAAGFNFDAVPEALRPAVGPEARPPVKVSDFMSPGVFEETLGLTYDPRPWLTQRFGLSSKQTVVNLRRLRPIYGLAADEHVRVEVGLSSTTAVDREIFENVRLKSTLGLFAAFRAIENLPDATFENILAMRVNDWLGVDFEFTTLYDRDVSEDLQIKEVLSVGFTVVII